VVVEVEIDRPLADEVVADDTWAGKVKEEER
jgi:hypothetical protein